MMNTKHSMSALSKNRMYLDHVEILQSINLIESTMGKLYQYCERKIKGWKKRLLSATFGSVHIFYIDTYIKRASFDQSK